MKAKKRLFYLDFIRTIAMIIVVSYHFFVHINSNNINPITNFLSNSKWGIIGVTIFFILSGLSLTYVYDKKLDIKGYYKKRFLSIYPLFWIVYITFFSIIFIENGAFIWNTQKWVLIFSVLGIDGYVFGIKTAYIVGEWFLGCLVILYIIYPFILKAVKKYPKSVFIIISFIYLLTIIFSKNLIMPISFNFFVQLYLFIIGIYIAIYGCDIKWWQSIIALIICICLFIIPDFNANYTVLFANVIGLLLFISLKFLSDFVKNNHIRYAVKNLSHDSYAIFLVHHVIILKLITYFFAKQMTIFDVLILYIISWMFIILIAKIFLFVKDKIMDYINASKEYEE